MTISYYLADPTGNITLLVKSPVSPEKRKITANALMKAEPTAEQVGFIDGLTLNMAGGEFCGNATISAAAVYCYEKNLDCAKINMTVSGADEKVGVEISKTAENEYTGQVDMPSPLSITKTEIMLSGSLITVPVVNFKGISHIILTRPADPGECEREIVSACKKLGADCLGIMLTDGKHLKPLVYVSEPETLVWESSCASGSTAAAIYFALKNSGRFDGEFSEPGGSLHASAVRDSVTGVVNSKLKGRVILKPVRECRIED